MRIRACFCRGEELKFLSHLELMRTFIRAIRRASILVEHTGGFNPQPRITFALPLQVGVTAEAEYFDLILQQPMDGALFSRLLNAKLPPGVKVMTTSTVEKSAPALMTLVEAALYRVEFFDNTFIAPVEEGALSEEAFGKVFEEALKKAVSELLLLQELVTKRKGKKGVKEINIRPFIIDLYVAEFDGGESLILHLLLQTGNRGGVRPDEVIAALLRMKALSPISLRERAVVNFHRVKLFTRAHGKLTPLTFL